MKGLDQGARIQSDAEEDAFWSLGLFCEEKSKTRCRNGNFAIAYIGPNFPIKGYRKMLPKKNGTITYRIYGDFLYKRKEIKDVLSYLRCH